MRGLLVCLVLSWPLYAADLPALPYKAAGLSEAEAAAHLLSRLTYGARPGEVEAVVAMGLEQWLTKQLAADQAVPVLDAALAKMPDLQLSNAEVAAKYPDPGRLIRQMQREGQLEEGADQASMRREARMKMAEMGYKPQRQLVGQMRAQKLLRAVYDKNQVREVLTDFWFNHFNVSVTHNRARGFVMTYERDAIRPHVLGNFRVMLGATAKHPAMLLYLDNALSTAAEGVKTTVKLESNRRRGNGRAGARGGRFAGTNRPQRNNSNNPLFGRNGLNENYARELLELHTLGVDGGYTQADVVAVARAFTGWTLYPHMTQRRNVQRAIQSMPGFERDGDFLFRANAHDAEAKRILGVAFPAGGGREEGERVLDMLSQHRATARFIATKFATRFHSAQPPAELVDSLASSFLNTGGDLQALVKTLVSSPHFWSDTARAQKVKTPLELAASAIRALDAEITRPRFINDWLEKMGQPLYAYAAPTGFPDDDAFWINAGLLVNRVNFVRDLALGRIEGVTPNRELYANWKRSEKPAEAMTAHFLPYRDTAALQAVLVKQASTDADLPEETPSASEIEPVEMTEGEELASALAASYGLEPSGDKAEPAPMTGGDVLSLAASVLASPDFQRR